MRSMLWQLGILGIISAFAFRHRETKKKSLISSCCLVLNVQTPWNHQKEIKYNKTKPVCKVVISNSKTFGDISPKVYL